MFVPGSRRRKHGGLLFEIHSKLLSHKMTTHCRPAATGRRAGEKRDSRNSAAPQGPGLRDEDLNREGFAMNTFMATATPGTVRGLIFCH